MIRISDNLEVNKPAPIDDRLGVFSSTASALAYIPEDRRYIGLTVIVDTGSGAEEYWFESGVEDGDLTAKSTGGGGATWGTITGTLSNQTDLQNALNAKVPYTGATQNVDLGTYNLTADQVNLNVSPTGTLAVGGTQWNDTIGSSETLLKGGSVTLKNGVDLVARVVNKVNPNTTLTKASYQVVKVAGAQGQRLAVELARANNDLNSADTLGVVIETIAPNQEGFIMTVGQLEGINTTGSLQGETWADGDVLYLSPTTAGRVTNVKPNGLTGHIVVIGYVEYAHANNGKIYVKVMNGWELAELHDVYINPGTLANNDALLYDSTAQLWENQALTKSLVGLGNVDNTSDANKPISTATQTALDRITTLFQNVSQLTTTSTTAVTLTTFTVASANIPIGGVIRIVGLAERTAGANNISIGLNINSAGARYFQAQGQSMQFEMLICKMTSTTMRYGLGPLATTTGSFNVHNAVSVSATQDGSGNFVISLLGFVGTSGSTLTIQFVKGNLL